MDDRAMQVDDREMQVDDREMQVDDRANEIVVAGHVCCDLTPAFPSTGLKMEDVFVPGKLVNVGAATISTGGPVSNTGLALKKLGAAVKLMGKIGDDFLGDGVLSLLRLNGVSQAMQIVPGENTSYTVAVIVPGYDRIFLHCTGANDTFTARDIDYETVSKAQLFHFGYPPLMRGMFDRGGAELVKIFKEVKSLGVTTSLDMSLPDPASPSGKADWDGILRDLLPYVDIYLPSVEETLYMIAREKYDLLRLSAGQRDLLDALDLNILPDLGGKLKQYGAKIVALKCGVKGFYLTTGDETQLHDMGRVSPRNVKEWACRELHEESFHVPDVLSATGAGDCSIAGFLRAYMTGNSPEDSIRIACAVGGENVSAYDALSGVKTWDETISLISGWEKNRLEISGGYFQREESGLWFGKGDRYYAG